MQAEASGVAWRARIGCQATPELSIALKVNNLFDKKRCVSLYDTAARNSHDGDPRDVMLTLRHAPRP
ncbi:hypothetical protein [Achromobacter sp. Marseille-Q4962]|uniref:hypothetical protein n=1 Tax=Achromobacter sp. Marseille-Q4962 TaxID=2942202 RepID=UPI002072FB7E|nr:hypothetical protein [Achromobacter sp. Marseille-Q4962]